LNGLIIEFLKFIVYSALIVVIAKYILVTTLRKLAEALNLKPKTVGDIAGYATSAPELLTITTASFSGLMSASSINVLSSNIINLIQYIFAIFLNKNQKTLRNKAIKVDLILVLLTIILPIILLKFNIEMNIAIVPMFIILYTLFRFLNNNVHKLYLKSEDDILEKKIEKDRFTVAQKISQIKDMLLDNKEFKFTDLFESSYSKSEVINTFLALLELLKRQYITVRQNELFSDIDIVKNEDESIRLSEDTSSEFDRNEN